MPGTIFVNLDALHREAKVWADDSHKNVSIIAGTDPFSMAEVANSAAGAAEAIGLGAQELSWVAVETGLLDAYEALRLRTAQLLREGASNFELVADELLKAMVEYSRTDDETDQAIRNVWEPRTPEAD